MQLLGYIFFRVFILFIAILPFRIIYLLSDFFAFILGKVLKYRQSVIMANLSYAFPEKDQAWRESLLPDFYRNFTDILFESFKGMTLPVKKIDARYYINMEDLFIEHSKQGKDVVSFAAHYTNWEWGVIALASQTPYTALGFYKPLSNKYIDNYIASGRAKSGIYLVSIYGDKAEVKTTYDLPKSLIYVSDQNPTDKTKSHIVDFLGKKTPALHGAAEFAYRNGTPSWFYKIMRVSRGKYQVDTILLFDSNEAERPQQITQKYFSLLEKQIVEDPANWLWSHKRWKGQIDY